MAFLSVGSEWGLCGELCSARRGSQVLEVGEGLSGLCLQPWSRIPSQDHCV